MAVHTAWRGHERLRTGNGVFDLVCSSVLMDRLVETSIRCIEQVLPTLKRYSRSLSQDKNIEQVSPESSLEDILNWGTHLLYTQSEGYASWERDLFRELGWCTAENDFSKSIQTRILLSSCTEVVHSACVYSR